MPHNWNRMQQSNRQPQLELKRYFYRLDKELTVSHTTRESEERRLWDELFQQEKEHKKGLLRSYTKDDFFNPKVQIYPSQSNRIKGEEDPVPLSQVYREFLIFKTKKTLELFGDRRAVRPRYSELYKKTHAPKFNNERSVTLLFDRSKPLSPVTKVQQLALVIPARTSNKHKETVEDKGYIELPAITAPVLGDDENIESSEHKQQNIQYVSGRQSVSRHSLRRGFPAVTSELPANAAVSARNVTLEGLGREMNGIGEDKNENGKQNQSNKTFITQPIRDNDGVSTLPNIFEDLKSFKKE